VSSRAFEARSRGDRAEAESLNGRAATLIRDGRARFPADPAFVQLDCELAVRRGEATKAVALTQEIDKMPGGAPAGAILRAGIYTMQGRTRDVAAAYAEALERNPRQFDIRLRLAQADLRLGDVDGALQQARLVLDADPDQPAARMIEARALASAGGSPSQVAASRAQAAEILRAVVQKRPEFIEAYHQLAEIHAVDGSKDRAIETLRAGLKAVPTDANGLSIAVRILCEPAAAGKPADPARLDEARALAEEFAGADTNGAMAAAAAIGFHRAGELDAALPWGEKAAKLSDAQGIHLNFGDLLLTLAESRPGAGRDGYLTRALAEFDRVLKDRPDTIEAVNNKAWILHTYLKRSQEALDLAEAAVRRAEPAGLPPEFYDTLGSIQEATGHAREAEESYRAGLEKAPEMPMLNFHMARLILADKARAGRAAAYLERAQAGRDKLPPAMAAEVAALAEKVSR
ncbi:MAG TPA: tetratricopeptide repeat protein, partial [Isosphaeraceae bacterium]